MSQLYRNIAVLFPCEKVDTCIRCRLKKGNPEPVIGMQNGLARNATLPMRDTTVARKSEAKCLQVFTDHQSCMACIAKHRRQLQFCNQLIWGNIYMFIIKGSQIAGQFQATD
mmetsp:Transcript_28381/g.87811  ORF Transcript_28381/g.87811 Transcript_28381/m.87811 type:complete len:112 (+) Transcript_28381:477-812(+)